MKEMFIKQRDPEENYYQELQLKTLSRLTELSGKIWTDFNIHDPGVTISDYLNYALYDLDYRLSFPLESYLFSQNSEYDIKRKGLFTKEELYIDTKKNGTRKSIVTEEDYEELFLKKYPESIEKCSIRLNKKTLQYDIYLDLKSNISKDSAKEISQSVKKTYHEHRNLGENLQGVYTNFDLPEKPESYKRKRRSGTIVYEFPEFYSHETTLPNSQPFLPDYESIQHDFPGNYGLSKRGIPDMESPQYESGVLQLKAYLLIFDILMAEQLQEAANIAKLFELNEQIPLSQLPEVTIVNAKQIIDTEKRQSVLSKIQENPYNYQQKSNYLDMLDVLYNEHTKAYFSTTDLPASEQISHRIRTLKWLPKWNEYRFRSFNIMDLKSTSVFQHIFELVMGKMSFKNQVQLNHIHVISDTDFFEQYEFLILTSSDQVLDIILPEELPKLDIPFTGEDSLEILRLHINLIWHGVLFESLLEYGPFLTNYKVAMVSDQYLLLFIHPEKDIVLNMSVFFNSLPQLIEVTNLFCSYLSHITAPTPIASFYLIEHHLLNFVPDIEKSMLSVLVHEGYSKEGTELLLKTKLPAHLQVTLYYLPTELLTTFQGMYLKWRTTLQNGDEKDIIESSQNIKTFLINNYNYRAKK